ncbi:MAG: tRNA (adenosine(37)-N6)-threonylcarbamoyltransferase complex ATPase subunit type 1 TsaE [Zoogloeaceae bacterium]|nr:tRNA (adenosine(37)-N6)-threonylcarbamoyltransferase complex ATPase subunit type 1 TsaE [Zoogloeaceae bacterium]
MRHEETCCWQGTLSGEVATRKLGAALASALSPGLVVYLEGDLGVGKTTLTRALLNALGHAGAVKSPTYALVEVYVVSRLYLYHFDFYRFVSPEEFEESGLEAYFHRNAVCLVEWPEKAAGHVPPADVRLALQHVPEDTDKRHCELRACSAEGRQCLNHLLTLWPRTQATAV